jgi:hypothetical protein
MVVPRSESLTAAAIAVVHADGLDDFVNATLERQHIPAASIASSRTA